MTSCFLKTHNKSVNRTVKKLRFFPSGCYGKDAKTVEDFPAEKQVDLGRPVQLHITIRKRPEKSVVFDKSFASICRAGHDGNTRKSQIIGLVELQQGAYLVEVQNEVAFALAGCSSLAHGYKRASLAEGCVALVLSAFLIIGLWITFAPGAHQCAGSIAGLGFAASDASCRVAFGVGSIVVGVMLFFAVRGLLQRRPAR